jgi:hypothetical protein
LLSFVPAHVKPKAQKVKCDETSFAKSVNKGGKGTNNTDESKCVPQLALPPQHEGGEWEEKMEEQERNKATKKTPQGSLWDAVANNPTILRRMGRVDWRPESLGADWGKGAVD